mmetsp:Transcript_2790/g.6962  ORF Transcript_2790/g.6962 Transcript_2790/m.6962 type:complete len:388 (+) Transcript_2790:411-1574(+)
MSSNVTRSSRCSCAASAGLVSRCLFISWNLVQIWPWLAAWARSPVATSPYAPSALSASMSKRWTRRMPVARALRRLGSLWTRSSSFSGSAEGSRERLAVRARESMVPYSRPLVPAKSGEGRNWHMRAKSRGMSSISIMMRMTCTWRAVGSRVSFLLISMSSRSVALMRSSCSASIAGSAVRRVTSPWKRSIHAARSSAGRRHSGISLYARWPSIESQPRAVVSTCTGTPVRCEVAVVAKRRICCACEAPSWLEYCSTCDTVHKTTSWPSASTQKPMIDIARRTMPMPTTLMGTLTLFSASVCGCSSWASAPSMHAQSSERRKPSSTLTCAVPSIFWLGLVLGGSATVGTYEGLRRIRSFSQMSSSGRSASWPKADRSKPQCLPVDAL